MVRIATYNLENLDNGGEATAAFETRAPLIRAALDRMRADIVCFQEINGQDGDDGRHDLIALRRLLDSTRYERHTLTSTLTTVGDVYVKRNLVTAIPPAFTLRKRVQFNGDRVPHPTYKRGIAGGDAREWGWERPILYTELADGDGNVLHVLNVHFKSKIATSADDQMVDSYTWRSAAAWAEGYFLSSIKRVGAALEARAIIDDLFDADPDAAIVIAGDFNADSDEVPVMAIRGRVEETGNGDLTGRVMVPLENNVPEPMRYSLFHKGKGEMIDHVLASRRLVRSFDHTEIHNETLPDESIAFATDTKFPEPDHAPVIAEFRDDLLAPLPSRA